MKHLIWIALAMSILLTIAVAGGYWVGRNKPSPLADEVSLEYKPIITKGVTEDEQKQIKKFVETFEGYKLQKDPDKLLAMFAPPDTPEDQDRLNSILGKDYARGSTKPLSRLFSTQGYNHSVGGHYVRSIKKDDNSIIVVVDELRIFYIGLSEDFVGYSVEVVNLTLEIEERDGEYKISKYYHSGNNLRPKYEGFIAQ